MTKLEEVDNFDEELKMVDIDRFTEAVKLKLNSVINEIAPFRRVQICRDATGLKDKDAIKLFEAAKEAKSRAIKSNDSEEFRLARNLTAVARRKNYVSEAKRMKLI